MFKQKVKISSFLLILTIFISMIIINVPESPKNKSVENTEDRSTQISVPKLSDAPVVEKWNYSTGATTIQEVAVSKDGNFTALRTDLNMIFFNKSSNIPMWTYNRDGLRSVEMSNDGKYILASKDSYVYLLNDSIESPKTAVWTFNDPAYTAIYSTGSISDSGEDIIFVYNDDILFFNNTYSSGNKEYEWALSHPDGANWQSVKISANGKYIVYGSTNGYVYFFNTNTPTTYEIKFNTTTVVKFVDISADGKYIVAGNTENEVYLLNTTDYQGKAMWNYTCPSECILADLGISAQGNQIVVGYNNPGTVCQFNNIYFTGNKVPMWSYVYGPTGVISSIDMSSDGRYIVAGYTPADTTLKGIVLLNTTVTVPKDEIWIGMDFFPLNVKSVAISGNGEYFAAVEDNSYRLYFFYHDAPRTPSTQFQNLWDYETVNTVNDLDISKTGKYIAAAIGNNMTLFDTSSNATIWSFESTGANSMTEIGISYNGTYIIGCNGSDYSAQVFLLNNTPSGAPWNAKEMWKFPTGPMDSYGCTVDISDDGEKIVVGDGNSQVYLFNNSFSLNKQYEWYDYIEAGDISDIEISWNGSYFVAAIGSIIYLYNTSNPSTYEWSFDTTQIVKEVGIAYDISKDIYYITAYNQDEVYLLNSSFDSSKTEMWNFSITTGTFNDIAIADNGNYTVIGDNSGYVYVLNNTFSTDKKPEWKCKRSPDREVKSMDISSDGKIIVVGYSTTYTPDWGLVQLFNTSAADPTKPIWWDLTKNVSLVAISGLGDYIAVGTPNPHIYLFYKYVYIPPMIRPSNGGGDGDDGEEAAEYLQIPFGNYYLIFIPISIISLIILKKRKVFLKEK